MGSLIRELMSAFLPGLRRAVEIGEAYAAANDAVRTVMTEAVVAADHDLGPQIEELRRATEAVFDKIVELGGDDPRLVITGVTNQQNLSD